MYVELLASSCFSFLRGASHPEEMIKAAAELGLGAMGLCDLDGMYGVVRAWKAKRALEEEGKKTLPFIVGAELTVSLEVHRQADTPCQIPKEGRALTVALLVQNKRGYENLCRLISKSHEAQEKGKSVCEVGWFSSHHEGLYALIVAPHDPRRLKWPSQLVEDQWLQQISRAFSGRIAVALYRHLDGLDSVRQNWAARVSERAQAPIVATARPSYHSPKRKPLSDVLHCIRKGHSLDEAGAELGANGEGHLRSPEQMQRLFRDRPAWVERSYAIAQSCRFDLSELKYHFPCELEEGQSADERLAELTWEGVGRRYPGGISSALRKQLSKELRLIKKIGVAPYFLSTYDIVEIARRRKILCQGRGSAANSAVCFMLGITAVDPSRSQLLFERFLSEERAEPPDIDIDFEHERREEVIQEIYQKYGRERAAMVSEIISYRGKSALRDVSQVFGLSLEQAERLSSTVTWYEEPEQHEKRLMEAGFDLADPRLKQVIALADQLRGFPRHLSIHVGGFVLSSRPLYEVAPIEPARMPGRTVIPWDKDDIDALGFFKVDVLALGMLTAIRKAMELIVQSGGLPAQSMKAAGTAAIAARSDLGSAEEKGEQEPNKALPGSDALGSSKSAQVPLDFDPLEVVTRIPAEDADTYQMISRGDTVGVFQIESRAQMAMLPRLRPKRFYDLVIEVAIVRPGPIQGGMVHPFLRRRNGEEEVTCPHPDLWPILKRTLGVPLFQEQVMQISIVGAGYSGGEADQLRRDMAAWKKHGRLLAHRERLLSGFAKRGISKEFGEALFEQIKGFGEYGFPESHASSFALLVYASSWEKRHYPAHFTCALLNSQPMGFYQPTSLIRDAQAHGVEVRDVCVEKSDWNSTLEEASGESQIASDALGSQKSLRLGLRLIKGLGQETAQRIVAERQSQGFASLQDLVRRTFLKKDECEALAEAGALEVLKTGRRNALWGARAPRTPGLFDGVDIQEAAVELPEMHAAEQLVLDYGRKGLSVTDHPLRHHRARLKKLGVVRAADLFYLPKGRAVAVCGLVMARQRPATASGVVFITLEDETGSVNLIVYGPVFERYNHVARHSQMLLVTGEIERDGRLPVASLPAPSASEPKEDSQVELPLQEQTVPERHQVAQVTLGQSGEAEPQTPVIHVIVRHIERWGNAVATESRRADPSLKGFSRDFH